MAPLVPATTWWRRNQLRLAPWLFLAPGLIFFAIYVVAPIFQSIWLSFYDWDGLGEKTWIGLANYSELATDDDFYTSLKNNVAWLVLYMLAVPAGLAIALFLNQTVFGIRLYKSLFFFPFVISQVVVGLIFTWFYAPNFGLLRPHQDPDRIEHWHSCRRAFRHLRHHCRGALTADRLLHDPVPNRTE
jgi:multiple sugar transport system permease protein